MRISMLAMLTLRRRYIIMTEDKRGDHDRRAAHPKHFLIASDFDQTLSFNDSGLALSELIGASRFQEKVEGLALSNLVQQGGELAYLLRHDPEFRGVRREHLQETGRRVRLRSSIPALVEFLERGIDGCQFSFFVISAAPREVIQSALEGVVAPGSHLRYGARLRPGPARSAIDRPRAAPVTARLRSSKSWRRVSACRRSAPSTWATAALTCTSCSTSTTATASRLRSPRTASSRESRRSTVLSDDAFSVMVPILDQVLGWTSGRIRALFESNGLTLHEWEKARTDRITVKASVPARSTRSHDGKGRGTCWLSISGGPRRRCSSVRISAPGLQP